MLGIFLSLLLLTLIVFNSSRFQTWITSKATSYLSAQFKTKITIDRIKYFPFNGFALDNVYWGDQKNDTLFFVDELRFNLGGFNSEKLKLTLNDVIVEGGYCKIVTYPDSTFNIDVLFNILDPNDTIPDTLSPPFQLYFNRVACHNSRFRLIDSTSAFETSGFDGLNEDFHHIEIVARDFWIIEDSLHFDLRKLACAERSGIEVKNAQTIATIYPQGMLFDNLELNTAYSHIAHTFHMRYQSWDDMGDFNQKVNMYGLVREGEVDMRDLQYFSDALAGNTQHFKVDAEVTGTVDNIKIKTMDVDFGTQSKLNGNGTIKGLPDIDETFFDLKANQATTTKVDLERLLTMGLPDELTQLGDMKFNGRYTGFYNDFVAYGKFQSTLGSGSCDLNMKLGNSTTIPSYSGKLALTNFNIGGLVQQSAIGKTSLKAEINGKGFNIHDIESKIDAQVAYLEANHYIYKHIALGGTFVHKMFEGRFDMNDENAEVHFDGTIDLNKEIPLYKFKATVDYADLKALHFDTSNMVLSTKIDIDFSIQNIDNNEGEINLNKILFIKNGIDYPIENIRLKSTINGNKKSIAITSDMLSAQIQGQYVFSSMWSSFKNICFQAAPDYFHPITLPNQSTENFTFKIDIIDTRVLSDLFFPSVNIAGANFKGGLNNTNNSFNIEGEIEALSYNDYTLNQISTQESIERGNGTISLAIGTLSNRDTMLAQKISIQSYLNKNEINSTFLVADTLGFIQTTLFANTLFSDQTILTKFDSSQITYKHKQIQIGNNANILYSKATNQFSITNLNLFHDQEHIALNGFYAPQKDYHFTANLDNVHLSIINLIFQKSNIKIRGEANGEITLQGNHHNFMINTSLALDTVVLDNDSIGNFTIASNYDEQQKRFVSVVKSTAGQLKNLELGGYIDTRKSPYEVNFNLAFAESDLRSFQAFIKEDATIFYGRVSAKCKLTGTVNKLVVDGDIHLNQVLARIEYLKTVYAFNTTIGFTQNTININPFQVTDIYGKKAKVSGSISHQYFSNFMYNIQLNELNGFQVLNTTSKDNTLFYGKAYATGKLSITGPQDDLMLEATLKSTKGTVFNIPLSESQDEDGDALLNFVNKDTTLKSVNMQDKSSLIGFRMNMFVTITPDAQIQLVFDETQDDKIIGTGQGALQMELTKQGNFNIYGDVTIEDGEYKFTAIDIFTRKFTLKRGGSIIWTGDPLQAKMNIQGLYKIRSADVSKLLPSSDSTRKLVAVECLLNLKGYLTAPEIGFDLNFPDNNNALLGNNASALENTLRRLRNEPDLMQQQVVSLMLFNTFVSMQGVTQQNPDIASEINNTLSSLISAQTNSILGKVAPGLNVSTDYRLPDEKAGAGAQAYFSASKRFLNDKFELRASIDMLNTGTSNITGQYNLRPDGNLKLIGFNRSAKSVINTGYTQNVNSQGVGLYYRKEFDSFSELLRKKQKQIIIPNN